MVFAKTAAKLQKIFELSKFQRQIFAFLAKKLRDLQKRIFLLKFAT